MKVGRFAAQFGYSMIGALVLASVWSSRALAQDDHSHGIASQQRELTAEQKSQAGALVRTVREATERFKDVAVAEAENYHLLFGCVSGGDYGAMGMHFVNLAKVFDGGKLDAADPEIVIYEPTPNGRLRLIGADYLVPAADWDAKNPGNPPQLMGQLFHFFESPNRFGLPPFYTLHVWAWKENPTGAFVNWHTRVSCEGFAGQD